MANPFETLKKGMDAMNPFGGNATPPKKAGKPDMGKIRAKGKEIAGENDAPVEGKKGGFPFKKGK